MITLRAPWASTCTCQILPSPPGQGDSLSRLMMGIAGVTTGLTGLIGILGAHKFTQLSGDSK